MKLKLINVFLLIVAAGVFVYAFFIYDKSKPIHYLPIYGEKSYEAKGNKTDTTYHSISAFSFTNQDGKIISEKDYDGSIYVADFFFTTCHSICPIMSNEMERVYNKYKGNKRNKRNFMSNIGFIE